MTDAMRDVSPEIRSDLVRSPIGAHFEPRGSHPAGTTLDPHVVDRSTAAAGIQGRVRLDGKQFAVEDQRFLFRGVTYGTFAARADGALFPERDRIHADFAAIARAGFTVARTYTAPSEDVLDIAASHGVRLFAGAFSMDWRYLIGSSRRERARSARQARAEIRAAVERLAGRDEVAAICVGNEIPADVIRWHGAAAVAGLLESFADVVRDVDPDLLVSYANYPTSEYLSLDSMDFLTFNVYLEDRTDFRRYLTRLHNLAGDRPLVLGELGVSAGPSPRGEREQAEILDWQLETATERGVAGTCVFSWTDDWWVGGTQVEGWRFGLTDADRQARPSLAVAQKWNGLGVRDLDHDWPSMSVVVCGYNASDTLDECLAHTAALDYPGLEVIMVDDGSTDDTADIARRHPTVRLLQIPHAGLSVARNEGARAANNDLVVYLDADAYPSPEWPYYLALGLDGPKVGGVGGPNVPPADDGLGAERVARAPGGPVHVLTGDDRAEHIPGCNMAFWRSVLFEVGGFDPIYTSAGDDVDLCWKVLDRGWDIGFHPAALVWHHRRGNTRTYLRQQRGYGRAEALVEARHPDRFGPLGSARWRGHIYSSMTPSSGGDRIYRGLYGVAAYQSIYQGASHTIDVVHQVGVVPALALMVTAPLGAIHFTWAIPALIASIVLVALWMIDTTRVVAPRHLRSGRLRFRASTALLHLVQPVARTWGRRRHRSSARRDRPMTVTLPERVPSSNRTALVYPEDRPREEFAIAVIDCLRSRGLSAWSATGWEDHDARLSCSFLVDGRLVTSAHPPGWFQLKVRPGLRRTRLIGVAFTIATAAALLSPAAGMMMFGLAVLDVAFGLLRSGPAVSRALRSVER